MGGIRNNTMDAKFRNAERTLGAIIVIAMLSSQRLRSSGGGLLELGQPLGLKRGAMSGCGLKISPLVIDCFHEG